MNWPYQPKQSPSIIAVISDSITIISWSVFHFPGGNQVPARFNPYGPFKCYVTLFSREIDPHPPPRNANIVEPYTFVTLFLGMLFWECWPHSIT